MSSVRGIHDPAELALYGLPAGVWAWLIEPDTDELTARNVDAARFSVTVVAVDSWPTDTAADHDAEQPGPERRRAVVPGLIALDVQHLSVRLIGTPAELVWLASPGGSSRLDLRNIGDLNSKDVLRLRAARRLVHLDWGPDLGRPPGKTALSADEFEETLKPIILDMRHGNLKPNQDTVATAMHLDKGTLRAYLKRSHISWEAVRSGRWPR
jgi:hypothetical protein